MAQEPVNLPVPVQEILDAFFKSVEFEKAWGSMRAAILDMEWVVTEYSSRYPCVTVSCPLFFREFDLIGKVELNPDLSKFWTARGYGFWTAIELSDPFFHNSNQHGGAFERFWAREYPKAPPFFEQRWQYDAELRAIGEPFSERFMHLLLEDTQIKDKIVALGALLSSVETLQASRDKRTERAEFQLSLGVSQLSELGWTKGAILEAVQDLFIEEES